MSTRQQSNRLQSIRQQSTRLLAKTTILLFRLLYSTRQLIKKLKFDFEKNAVHYPSTSLLMFRCNQYWVPFRLPAQLANPGKSNYSVP